MKVLLFEMRCAEDFMMQLWKLHEEFAWLASAYIYMTRLPSKPESFRCADYTTRCLNWIKSYDITANPWSTAHKFWSFWDFNTLFSWYWCRGASLFWQCLELFQELMFLARLAHSLIGRTWFEAGCFSLKGFPIGHWRSKKGLNESLLVGACSLEAPWGLYVKGSWRMRGSHAGSSLT